MQIDPHSIKVALLAGGTSGEREISLASGQGASAALREAGFDVTELDPARTEDLVALAGGDFDVAFLCLHGRGGEDGTMQGMLEVIGLPYTGPGVWSSATAIDKAKSKLFYERAGIPTPAWVALQGSADASVVSEFAAQHGWPVVVKPALESRLLLGGGIGRKRSRL